MPQNIKWSSQGRQDRGDAYSDQSHATNIERREAVCQELWNAHLESPTFALSEALRKEETLEDGFLGWREQKLIFM